MNNSALARTYTSLRDQRKMEARTAQATFRAYKRIKERWFRLAVLQRRGIIRINTGCGACGCCWTSKPLPLGTVTLRYIGAAKTEDARADLADIMSACECIFGHLSPNGYGSRTREDLRGCYEGDHDGVRWVLVVPWLPAACEIKEEVLERSAVPWVTMVCPK